MTTTAEQLAAALRDLLSVATYSDDADDNERAQFWAFYTVAREALARYDAEQAAAARHAESDFARFVPEAARLKVSRLIDLALAKGYRLSVFDGEEWVLNDSDEYEAVIGALGSTGYDMLRVRDPASGAVGGIDLIYENEEDVIADYNLVPHIEELVNEVEA